MFIKLNQVKQLTSLSKSSIYKMISEGKFPKQYQLGARCVAWRKDEVEEWVFSRKKIGTNS